MAIISMMLMLCGLPPSVHHESCPCGYCSLLQRHTVIIDCSMDFLQCRHQLVWPSLFDTHIVMT